MSLCTASAAVLYTKQCSTRHTHCNPEPGLGFGGWPHSAAMYTAPHYLGHIFKALGQQGTPDKTQHSPAPTVLHQSCWCQLGACRPDGLCHKHGATGAVLNTSCSSAGQRQHHICQKCLYWASLHRHWPAVSLGGDFLHLHSATVQCLSDQVRPSSRP